MSGDSGDAVPTKEPQQKNAVPTRSSSRAVPTEEQQQKNSPSFEGS